MKKYPLTQYSHGAGCGCKIAPAVLDQILQGVESSMSFPNLLVGNAERDDAAVYDLGDGTSIISTTDFFMPIVDDPFDFGRIAATNAISDIYAMGGTPIMAISILGWPINTIPTEVAREVVRGGKSVCEQAGIALAGGHSIDCPEPIFGLAVTGKIATDDLKRNGGAQVGDLLYLTKPLGVGILATAQKKGLVEADHLKLAIEQMTRLNRVGESLARLNGVHALTDVTGFGLLGHLSEMCAASHVSAEIFEDVVSFIDSKATLKHYLDQGCFPGGTNRNWNSYQQHIAPISEQTKYLLADPQTSGGLLVALDPTEVSNFEVVLSQNDLKLKPIGRIVEAQEYRIRVR